MEDAETTRDEALEEVKRLRKENGMLKKQTVEVFNAKVELAMKVNKFGLEVKEGDGIR